MTMHPEDLLEALNNTIRLKEQAEIARKESEALLSGITSLLETDCLKDIYRNMFNVLGKFIPYEQAFVLEQHSPGLMKCSTSTEVHFENTLWEVDPVFKRTVLGTPCAVYSIARQPAWKEHLPKCQPTMASALYCPFNGPNLDAILVFCHREKGFYIQSHVHMAERYRRFTKQTLLSVNAKMLALESQQLRIEKERAEQGLIQSEKMASLGLLAAGIAHEINNPIGYVTSNIRYLENNLKDIYELKNQFDHLIKNTKSQNQDTIDLNILQAEQWIKDNHISETVEDLHELVSDCQQGLSRISDIVGELNSFARADDDSLSEIDINKCIESTVKLVSNELKYHCDLSIKLGQTNNILANEGKINQVLTNLLVNAGQAISDNGKITIRSGILHHKIHNKCVWFSVEDNGCGIEPDNIRRIFEPFYTSKKVGEGTGLGLAISYSIIEKINGLMEVSSELNRGTKFTVYIPPIEIVEE